jgi:4-hydroxyproline epimerase
LRQEQQTAISVQRAAADPLNMTTTTIHVIDSHTAGEPTRVVIDGGPPLGRGPLSDRLQRFRQDFDHYRTAIVREPRGSDVLVGALVCEPQDQSCDAGVIFFNNVGYLGMCGHGLIGVVETLRYLERNRTRQLRIETPVGIVAVELNEDGSASIENVTSYRKAQDVGIAVDGIGTVLGDVAWGGNWFYLVREPSEALTIGSVRRLQELAAKIRSAINDAGYPEVDHVELFGQPEHPDSNSRNFVLCPGLEYDRSPCGTGTSAKLACLAADGTLTPGETWLQEGILGTRFAGRYRWDDEAAQTIVPTITGTAFVTSEAKLRLLDDDPFRWGI